ncbi:hypothetical protein B484DRAFT_393803 [Ochromonadaceae sp. CCMP2298]|nr:hypothetical protein B484DRAFT_393803 [Ochromonadaceae sp. CCMP2298]
MEFQSASSLFLLDSTKFGLDMALADGLKNLGDFAAAELFAKEAIDIAHHTEQSDNIYAAYAEGILAEISYEQGNFKSAADRFRHALSAYENHYRSKTGPQNVKSLGAAQMLSFAFMTGRRYDKAAEALKVELRNVYDVYGKESLEAADTQVNLGSAYLYTDNFDLAEHYYLKALGIYEAHMAEGLDPPTKPLQLIFTGMGDINYLRQKELTAMNYYLRLEELLSQQKQQTQQMQEQEQMQEQDAHPRKTYNSAMKNLGLIKWRLGDFADAQRRLRNVLKTLQEDEQYGEEHPQTLSVKQKLIELHKDIVEQKYGN